MSNLKLDLLALAKDEPVLAVVIGNMGWEDYGLEEIPPASQDRATWNKVLTWKQAAPLLDYEFDSGYGAPGCQAITAWTATRVFFVSQYDGSTRLESVPRNPIDHEPEMPGG